MFVLSACVSVRTVKGKLLFNTELGRAKVHGRPQCALTLRSKGQKPIYSSPFILAQWRQVNHAAVLQQGLMSTVHVGLVDLRYDVIPSLAADR